MQDIVNAERRKARLPLFVCALSVVSAAAIGWNALVTQSGTHLAAVQPAVAEQQIRAEISLPAADPVVLEIQTALKGMNLYAGELDGLSGPATRNAVTGYQSRFGLVANGKPDQEVLAHIQFNEKLEQAARYTGSTTPRESATRSPDVEGSSLTDIQKGLAELGYQPGPIDGQLGAMTRTAIREFQRDRSLAITGDLSPGLAAELAKVTGKSSLGEM